MILGTTERQRIRTVFIDRAESYPLSEVARLTGIPPARLRREVRSGDRDAEKVNGRWRFTWRQLVFVALERWTLTRIQDALGADASHALPPLLSLRSVTVRLPEYIVRALELVATDDGMTVDDCLYGELIDFAGAMSDRLARRVPGYRRAYLFPAQE
ncbi:MAG TPA: hypothetical protein VLC46_00675 [Thermoanaerobaculia bacterium]|jgi:hypothetical protein|nr:hypothetical protein [Thermoanaerobaculia bacterium]